MTIYKNLENLEFQIMKEHSVAPFGEKNREQYMFFFRNKIDKTIGIPVPDFSSKNAIETYSEYYMETFIFECFDKYSPSYFSNQQFFIQTRLSKNELNRLKKELKNLYAKDVTNIISPMNNVELHLEYSNSGLSANIVDLHSLNRHISENSRLDEFKFILNLVDMQFDGVAYFKHYGQEIDIDEIKNMLNRFGFKMFYKDIRTKEVETIEW